MTIIGTPFLDYVPIQLRNLSTRCRICGSYLDDVIKKAGNDKVILLQEKGENLDSIGYSEKMKEWRISTSSVHLVVGPPGGFGSYGGDLKSLSLGKINMWVNFDEASEQLTFEQEINLLDSAKDFLNTI